MWQRLLVVAACARGMWRGDYAAAVNMYGAEKMKYSGLWDEEGCLGDSTARQIFLPETSRNGSVAIPIRAADLDCYVKTKWRKTYGESGEGVQVAVAINGEVQRLDPNTTTAKYAVLPLSRTREVVVFLTLQSRKRVSQGEWHAARFRNMPAYDDAQEKNVLDSVAHAFLANGAKRVEVHVYDLIKRPPLMPSSHSGANPGKASVARFQLVWPSYALHLLVHSVVWRDVVEDEKRQTSFDFLSEKTHASFEFIYKMRADAGWLSEIPVERDYDAVRVKRCLSWGGVNDKLAIIPRRFADRWMDLLSLYYDDTFFGYKNSEQFQQLLAARYDVPIKRVDFDLATLDYYWWLPDGSGNLGCFPWNYAGLRGKRCDCVNRDLCPTVHRRVCAGRRPLGPNP